MLSLQSVTSRVEVKGESLTLLSEIDLEFHPGHLVAVVGPSGCGKTSLIKTVAGINELTEGKIFWNERDLEEEDFKPSELGYVPQFSIACEELTVLENVRYAAMLRTQAYSGASLESYLEGLLIQTGLEELSEKAVKVLSGGQKRRLSLAMELTANPEVLLCDEVTSGLDLHSERKVVKLLKQLAVHQNRLVISVTHSLEHLKEYDTVVVLHEGVVTYAGPPEKIEKYFKANNPSGIFHQLPQLPAVKWQQAWLKWRKDFPAPLLAESEEEEVEGGEGEFEVVELHHAPSPLAQTMTLIERRWKMFFRDRTQVMISLALAIGFPLLVILFSESGREPIRKLSDTREQNVFLELQNQAALHQDQLAVGSAVSGIIMFQVVLLCLMGSNNASREIAGERKMWEKERLAGVRPGAYLTSKLFYLGVLVFVQSSMMAFMVEAFWQFRGNFLAHWMALVLVNAAMTSICLAISSLFRTASQASLLSIYLVGFQLPLSGAVLTLPHWPEAVTRPFISAYWAWSGSMDSLQGNIYNAVKVVSGTDLNYTNSCYMVLSAHLILGVIFAMIGVRKTLIH